MQKSRRRPTQADVARLAGVSQAMVSYVLNNNTNISIPEETRQRILSVVDRLGYVPNKAARALRTNQTRTIAYVMPDVTNPFHTTFARGIQTVAQGRDYEFILYNTDRTRSGEQRSMQFLQQGRVDGVIITMLYLTAPDLLPLLEKEIMVVVQGPNVMPTRIEDYPLDSLYVNDSAAAYNAVSYLIENGHRYIAMIAGQPGIPPRQRREIGYRQALEAAGIPVEEALIADGDFKEGGGYLAMKRILTQTPHITAVFAASDLMALGALQATKEAGLRIPDDIAIVGFDDIPIARLVSPALTTIAQDQERMGQRAAEMLFDRLAETAPMDGRREEMPFQLIKRESA